MQQRQQVGLAARGGPELELAQFARQRHQREEHQADGGEMAEARQIVGAVRIDDRNRRRQLLVGLMMIDHHRVEAELLGFTERFQAGGAAIDGHQQLDAALGEGADRVDVRPVAFENPVGNMHQRIEPAVAQIAREQRRRSGAVHVVVAEDGDALLARDRPRQPRGGSRHVGQPLRVRHQPLDAGIEIGLDRLRLDAAAGEHPRQQFRHAGALRNAKRARLPARIQSVAPGAPARGLLHAEEKPLRCVQRRCRQSRHLCHRVNIGAERGRRSGPVDSVPP